MPITTLLFDLNNTLPGNSVQKFLAVGQAVCRNPAARETIQWAFNSGFKVAVASNRRSSRVAILQPPNGADFSTHPFQDTFELTRFTRPDPEYYAEALALIDSRPEETLMIGDDWLRDILPAHHLGLHTYWISPSEPDSSLPENHVYPAGSGTLADFLNWARVPNNLAALLPLPGAPRAVRAQQATTPLVLFTLTQAVSPANWKRRPRADEWSLTEIICHLRDVEIEVNLPRLKKVLNEPNPFISAVESDVWAGERDYQSQSGPAALAAFAAARRETVALLDQLTPNAWQRPARHAIFGPTTLQELAAFTVEHERVHLRQIKETYRTFAL